MRLFNQIKLLTPESVELEFTLAGIGSRALALSIDYPLIWISILLFWTVWLLFSAQLMSYLAQLSVKTDGLVVWLFAIAFLVSFVIFTGYFVYFEVVWQGQTPGKRFAKIRVIRDDGRPIGLSQAVLRSLLRSIDDFCLIGALFIFFGQREKRIGDWVAGTVVVQEARPVARTAIRLSAEATQLAPELPTLVDLTQLLPDDFAVVREYLQRRGVMEPRARSDLSLTLARQIRSIVHLETVPAGLNSDQFLEAVYIAYQEQFPAY